MNSSSKNQVTAVDRINKPLSVLIIGPFGAGKKTILYTAKHGQSGTIMPVIGIDFENLTINETSLMVWTIGGRSGFRPFWTQHYKRMSAFIFVVDSNDHERIDEAREQLHHLINNNNFHEKPILIFANKQDFPNAMNSDQLRDKLELEKFNKNIKWYIQPASAIQNQGLQQGFEWLMNSIQEKNNLMKRIIETFNDTVIMKNDIISIFSIAQLKTFITKFISLSFYPLESIIKLVDIKQTLFLK